MTVAPGRLARAADLAGVIPLLAACATPIPGASPDLLKFLRAGETSRPEVVLRLGQPSASFEQERILTYRLGQDAEQGYYVVTAIQVVPVQAGSWQWVR